MKDPPLPPEPRFSCGWDYPPSRLTKAAGILVVIGGMVIGIALFLQSPHTPNSNNVRLPIEQIARFYHDDPEAAEERYGPREIQFEMRVDEIKPIGPGLFIVIQIQPDDKLSHLGAVFDASCWDRLNRYEKGSTLRGRGRFMHAVNGIVLENCSLEK